MKRSTDALGTLLELVAAKRKKTTHTQYIYVLEKKRYVLSTFEPSSHELAQPLGREVRRELDGAAAGSGADPALTGLKGLKDLVHGPEG